jgi:hypothetical protein
MPAITGSLFVLPLLFFAWLLERSQKEDIDCAQRRIPMTGRDRKNAFEICISNDMDFVLYFLDLFRDFRDNFSRELWDSIGYKGYISLF